MTLAAIAGLVIPALRASKPKASRSDYDLTVYRDQLRDLKADVARGVLSPEEEKSARREISRRMIAAGATEEETHGDTADDALPASQPRFWRFGVAAVLIFAIPVVATPIYVLRGSPDTPGQPFASRTDTRPAEVEALPEGLEEGIQRLEARLGEEPDDLEGWLTLSRALMAARRYDQAIGALLRATALSPRHSLAQSMLGEAILFAAGGTVTPPALRAFEAANAADPQNIAARFYRALERAQAGEVQDAFDIWLTLFAESPADAPWMADLRARLEDAADVLKVDLAAVMPEPLPPRSAEAAQPLADAGAAPGQSDEAIRDMVASLALRLEDEPGDAEGWLLLGRSYQALGDRGAAQRALARAAELRPDNIDVLSQYARSMLRVPEGPGPVSSEPLGPQVRGLYGRILGLDADNPEALYFVGLGEAQAGDAGAAAAHWEHLLTLLEPASQAYRVVEEGLKGLGPTQ